MLAFQKSDFESKHFFLSLGQTDPGRNGDLGDAICVRNCTGKKKECSDHACIVSSIFFEAIFGGLIKSF